MRSIPEEVERSLLYLELRPPDLVELVDFLRDECNPRRRPIPSEAIAAQMARCAARAHARRSALRAAPRLGRQPRLGPESLPALLEEKRLLVNRSGIIEFIAEGGSLGEVGGSKA